MFYGPRQQIPCRTHQDDWMEGRLRLECRPRTRNPRKREREMEIGSLPPVPFTTTGRLKVSQRHRVSSSLFTWGWWWVRWNKMLFYLPRKRNSDLGKRDHPARDVNSRDQCQKEKKRVGVHDLRNRQHSAKVTVPTVVIVV